VGPLGIRETFKGAEKTAAHVKRVGRVAWGGRNDEGGSVHSIQRWLGNFCLFRCEDARTCYENLYGGVFVPIYFSLYFGLIFYYYLFYFFIPQPSSCLSDREEDEIYGLTMAERRFPPAAAAVRPPVHLNTAIRQHTVQQP